ncbi:MAG: beta-ketoacyl synthase N-terminal-like domain-containing protein [Xenococcus sp. MO_188.B8]|nr:beta-ketoacyl synthase N-terminal-like domain-containing protein [Xenococcus sp. MO_188.B8]
MNQKELQSSLQKNPVAIIGMAGIFPQSNNLREYWENIIDGVNCITDVPASRWNIEDYYDPEPTFPDKTYCKRGGFIPDIDFNPMEFGLPPNILEVTDVAQLLSLVVAKQAMEDAGYGKAHPSIRERTGVVLGVGGGQKLITPLTSRLQYPVWEKVLQSIGLSEEDSQKIIKKIKLAYIPWEENSFPGMLGNVISGRIANRLDLGGMNCVVDAACASSLSALRMALSELSEYRSDMMITGGVDTDNTIFMYMCFSKTPAFSKQGEIRPFDAEADGMLIGEAVGMMVLKRLEDAKQDGDRIYAVIKGIGTSSDGKYKSIYAPRSSGQALALSRAYEDAGLAPETVGLIEAHGTGTIAGDPTEFAALKEVFGENNPKKQHISLGSVKSQIGHTKSAAGAASLMKAALALHHKILPPTINVTQPNPKLEIEDSPFYLNTKTRPWFQGETEPPRRAGVSSFGFGGTNFHVVLEEYEREHHQPYRFNKTPEIILLAAPTPRKLLTRCQTVQKQLESDTREKHYIELIKSGQSLDIPLNSARVGFIAQSLTEASELLQITIDNLKNQLAKESWEHPKGIYYRQTGINSQGKVVALFSGQGSQYLEMGKELVTNFPQFRQVYQQMDRILLQDELASISEIVFPPPAWEKTQQDAQVATLQKTENAQPAIGVFSTALYKILQRAGFKPDFTVGHSFGELTALWAAGVLNDEDYYFLVKSRGQAMASPPALNFDPSGMLVVIGNIGEITEVVKNFPDLIIANWNSNNQVVLAGTKLELAKVQPSLEKLGCFVKLLPVSAAFHTPLAARDKDIFTEALSKVTFNSPQIPVYSNTTANPYPNNADTSKQILESHIVSPVHFKQEIENIYAAGGYFFIEFGPRNILTNLVKNILQDKPHLAIALNSGSSPGKKPLAKLQISKRDRSADHQVIKSQESPKHKQHSCSYRQLQEAVVQLRVAGLPLNNLDSYQLEQNVSDNPTKKGLRVSVNGSNYVSEKTKAAFEDALRDGHQVNSKVEKQKVSNNLAPTGNNRVQLSPKPESVGQHNGFKQEYTHSQKQITDNGQATPETKDNSQLGTTKPTLAELASVNKPKLPISPTASNSNLYSEVNLNQKNSQTPRLTNPKTEKISPTNNTMNKQITRSRFKISSNSSQQDSLDGLDANIMRFQQHQAEVVRSHEKFLQYQAEYTQQFFQLMQQQRMLLPSDKITATSITSIPETPSITEKVKVSSDIAATSPTVQPIQDSPQTGEVSEASQNRVFAAITTPTIEPVSVPTSKTNIEANGVQVKTLSLQQPTVHTNTSNEASAAVATPKTKKVETAEQKGSIPQPELESLTKSLVEVVSDKTGYPAEMLELEMDLEADLGIDSIKRVEIMGAMQELFPDLPPVNPEELAELRTLAQIVGYLGKRTSPQMTVSQPAPVSAATEEKFHPQPEQIEPIARQNGTIPQPELESLTKSLVEVVSDKTGYPAEMLELEMDLEADLGIDSIKRVEIMGAIQELFPDLPPVNPEELAELRTLAQIVGYLGKQSGEAEKKTLIAV